MKIKWKPIIFFVITVVVTLFLEKILSPSNLFKSPMYLLLPVVGFFSMYYTSDFIIDYMKIKNKYWFTLIFIAVALAAYYVMLFLYFWDVQAVLSNMKISFPFIKLLLPSAYLQFLIGCVFGIISK